MYGVSAEYWGLVMRYRFRKKLLGNDGACAMEEKIKVNALTFYYNTKAAIRGITLPMYKNTVTALIGPSGCGKSTFIRCINRMNDIIPNTSVDGEILIDGVNIYEPRYDVTGLRRRVGMVFQKSNPFPKSIFENIAYGLKINGVRNRYDIEGIVENSLKSTALWDEVKDRLNESALGLSGGQQQRLCIARTIAVQPEIILWTSQRRPLINLDDENRRTYSGP